MIRLMVNGELREVAADPSVPLVVVLRDMLGLHDTKFGCGQGRCGACTVMVGSQAVRSCQIPVQAVSGKPVTTIEGLGPAGPTRWRRPCGRRRPPSVGTAAPGSSWT